jgi:hypothetical protein
MPDLKISAAADITSVVATDKLPVARVASTTAYFATMAELATYAEASVGVGNVGRNLIHNAMFRVQQRGAGAVTAGAPTYTADRWCQHISTSTISTTLAALADADRTAIGDEAATAAMQCVVGGSGGAGDFVNVQQRIEGVQRLAGKSVVLTFWAKATSGTPKVGYSLTQNFGSGGSPSADVTSIGSAATAALSTTWTKYTSAAIAVPTSIGKTFGSTAGTDYTALKLWFTSGATNNAQAGAIGNQSGTIQLWGAQLEVGSVATPLEKPDPRAELANCQRFYQTGSYEFFSYAAAGAGFGQTYSFPVTMRAAPTVAVSATTTTNCASPSAQYPLSAGFVPYAVASGTGTVAHVGTFTAAADL